MKFRQFYFASKSLRKLSARCAERVKLGLVACDFAEILCSKDLLTKKIVEILLDIAIPPAPAGGLVACAGPLLFKGLLLLEGRGWTRWTRGLPGRLLLSVRFTIRASHARLATAGAAVPPSFRLSSSRDLCVCPNRDLENEQLRFRSSQLFFF